MTCDATSPYGILAEEARLDLDAGKAVAVDGEARDLLVGKARAQRHALEVLRFVEELLEALAVARLDVDDRRQLVDGRLEVADLRRRELERVRGVALREHDAVAVGDHAAIGDDRHDRDAVGLREHAVVVVLVHLQVHEAREQRAERGKREHARDHQAPAEEEHFAFRVAHLARRSWVAAVIVAA